ncbi:MAG: hypothetical protein AAFO07_21045 [Bacteroidota bacterium]
MKYTRIYNDEKGESHFEEVDIALEHSGEIGHLSKVITASGLRFRRNDEGYDWDFHNAPRRQFIILLDGKIEIEVSDGKKRIFEGGDILLVEDTEGKGHKTKHLTSIKRKSVFIHLD